MQSIDRKRKANPKSSRALTTVGVGASLAFVALTMSISRRKPSRLDRRVWSYFPEFRRPRHVRMGAAAVGRIGKTWMHGPAALAAAGYVWPKSRAGSATILISSVAGSALGHGFERLLTPRLAPPGRFSLTEPSYPSGHTLRATTVSLVSTWILVGERLVPRHLAFPLGVAIPIGVGMSRIYLDKHWATDVVGGWLAGIALGAGCIRACEELR